MTDVKSMELRLWHALLDDDQAARLRPEFQNGALHKHAEVLERLGVINGVELTELNELADARYADAAEVFMAELAHRSEP